MAFMHEKDFELEQRQFSDMLLPYKPQSMQNTNCIKKAPACADASQLVFVCAGYASLAPYCS